MDINTPGFRDAIHVPFVVVTCGENAPRGHRAYFVREWDEGETKKCILWHRDAPHPDWHGVVDPFSEHDVIPAGQPFRLMVRERFFSRMRHVFEIEVHDRGGSSTCHQVCDVW